MKRNLLSACSFLLGLSLLLTLLSLLFLPKGNTIEDGIQDPELYAFLAERPDSLDVVVLGDSIPLCAVVPAYLWQDWGIPGYVCASTAQKVSQSNQMLGQFLTRQSPKVVLLETDQLFLDLTISDVLTDKGNALFPVLQYHDNWKYVRPRQMLRPASYTYSTPEKGYHLRKVIESLDDVQVSTLDDTLPPISPLVKAQVKEILAQCRRSGAELVLFTAPNAASWTSGRHNALEALARELGIPHLDGHLEVMDMDWSCDSLDGGEHLNIWGAEKATSWLGHYLAATGLCPDRREDPGFETWEEDRIEFNRRVDDPEEYY